MMAGDDNQGPAEAIGTMEDILERENLKSALKRVVTNRGSAGVELRNRGVGTNHAANTAASPHGPWRISRSPALSYAIPDALLTRLGLPSLAPTVHV